MRLPGNITIDEAELRPLIAVIASECVARCEYHRDSLAGRIGLNDAEAAGVLGWANPERVARMRRKNIAPFDRAKRVGSAWLHSVDYLRAWLAADVEHQPKNKPKRKPR